MSVSLDKGDFMQGMTYSFEMLWTIATVLFFLHTKVKTIWQKLENNKDNVKQNGYKLHMMLLSKAEAFNWQLQSKHSWQYSSIEPRQKKKAKKL